MDNNRKSSSKKNITILWVDDQPLKCELGTVALKSFLEAAVEVDRASVAEVALDKLEKNHYDLIITDLVLPGMDGLELISHVRQRGIEVPIIVASANGKSIDRVRAFGSGADAYLVLPFSIEEFVATVEELLRHGRMHPDPRRIQQLRDRSTPKSESADGRPDWVRQWDKRIGARFMDNSPDIPGEPLWLLLGHAPTGQGHLRRYDEVSKPLVVKRRDWWPAGEWKLWPLGHPRRTPHLSPSRAAGE